MNLPSLVVEQIEHAMQLQVARTAAVGGGCISNTVRLEFESGAQAFLKWAHAKEHPGVLFVEEARSLGKLAATRTLRVPSVLHMENASGPSWLLMEWLEPGRNTPEGQRSLGRQLAALHRHASENYGWETDNYIGSLPQSNRQEVHWPAFWRDERLLPQLRRARDHLHIAQHERIERLAVAADEILAAAASEPASLLHGDLWSGNVFFTADGSPAVIDPSCYYGHREVDLAMTRLFGGFGAAFYDAYNEAWPLAPGSRERMLLYQMYYLLVHVNLFGASYVPQTMGVVAELGF